VIFGVALVGAVGLAALYLMNDRDDCEWSTTVIDGIVLPGGPRDSMAAFEGFLATEADNYDLPRDIHDWEGAGHESAVTWRHGNTFVQTSRQANGWMVSSIERTCT
jgi:hypothetical protein